MGDIDKLYQTSDAIALATHVRHWDLSPGEVIEAAINWIEALTQPPRPVGYHDMGMNDLDAYNALWSDSVFGYPFNVSGQPAISLPLGMTNTRVPIGIQMVGRHGDEAASLALATVLEQEMAWKDRHPNDPETGKTNAI